MGLAEGVPAGDQRDRLLVVHRHPAERLADVAGRGECIGVAVGTLRVDVDQAHLDGAERVRPARGRRRTARRRARCPRAPEDLLGLPDVLATEGEAEGLEAHVLQRDVAGEDHQVGPEIFRPYFCLTGHSRRRALSRLALSGQLLSGAKRWEPSPARRGRPRSGRCRRTPAHPDEGRRSAEVGGPPVLRGRHHLDDVALERLDVELRELGRVVEVLAHGVGRGRVLVRTCRSSWLGHQSWTVRGRLPVGVGVSIAGFSLSLPCAGGWTSRTCASFGDAAGDQEVVAVQAGHTPQ